VDQIKGDVPKVEWDFEGIHYFDNGPLTVQYLFVLDALNFCFWPGINSRKKRKRKAITSSEHVEIRMKCYSPGIAVCWEERKYQVIKDAVNS
jgi:hypothetical protein